MLKVYHDISDMDFWCGAEETADIISEADKWDELDGILEDMYPDGMSETELNDLLRFESEEVLGWLGLYEEEEEEEE